jgi:hypothetical protein
VVVDKPFTVTLSQARELDALAKSLGRLLSVFHNRRWDSDFLTVKRLLSEGTLGDPLFESHFDRFRPQVRNRWREQAGPGSGIWYDLAPSAGSGRQSVWSAGEHDGRSGPAQARSADDRLLPRVLSYPQRRIVLHGTMVAAESARYIIHGTAAT